MKRILLHRFPGKCVELRSPPKMKCFRDMIAYHSAYDNTTNKSVIFLISITIIQKSFQGSSKLNCKIYWL